MKKLLILSAAVLLYAGVVNAQASEAAIKKDERKLAKKEKVLKQEKKEDRKELKKLNGEEVSYAAKEQFAQNFGDMPGVIWRRDPTFDIATFTKDGASMSAYYDADANLVGTVTRKTFADLPLKAQEYIDKKYGDYTKVKVILYDDNETNTSDMILYDQQFEDADNYFIELSKNGKQIVLKSTLYGDVDFFKNM